MLVAHGDVSEPRFRLIGRYLLSLALYGCGLWAALLAPLPKQLFRG